MDFKIGDKVVVTQTGIIDEIMHDKQGIKYYLIDSGERLSTIRNPEEIRLIEGGGKWR